MIRWLFIALFIYMIYRLIAGPKKRQRQSPFFTFRYGGFPAGSGRHTRSGPNDNGKSRLDQIEEAEFEDITEDAVRKKETDS